MLVENSVEDEGLLPGPVCVQRVLRVLIRVHEHHHLGAGRGRGQQKGRSQQRQRGRRLHALHRDQGFVSLVLSQQPGCCTVPTAPSTAILPLFTSYSGVPPTGGGRLEEWGCLGP